MTGETDLKLWQRLSEAPVSSQAGQAVELFNVFSTEAVPELGLLLLKPEVELLLKGIFEGSPYLTNLVLREDLLREAVAVSGEKTYSRAVEVALEDFVRRAKARRILELRGSGAWSGDLAAMRQDARPGGRRRS